MHYNNDMMINSVAQLNAFAAQNGVKAKGQLLPKLIEKKEIISASLAKLITRLK